MRSVIAVASLLVFTCGLFGERPVDYNRDVRPILSKRCFYCHGLDDKSREAGLRLDTFEGATEDLGGYAAIKPGESDRSELVQRILTDDDDLVMPPTDTSQTLSDEEKQILIRWIDQGAAYDEHWAFEPLSASASAAGMTESETIDALLSKRWQEEHCEPVGMATPRAQLRRLSFDLRGIPPTATDVRQFEANPSDKLFFEFRDRWMRSLEYAEHQAVRWLDLVRWADTSGFVSDEPIASGAYRAWVIRAIQENLPFDQFSKMQLAGDLLPEPTDDALIASGYNRIVNTNCEAGAIELEQLYKLKGEHVRALGTVWLGMTTGCAECHDHKFDPLTSRDYYSLAAFFDDLVEAGVYTPGDRRNPLHYVHDEGADRQRDHQLSQELTRLRRAIFDRQDIDEETLKAFETRIKERLKETQTRGEFVWVSAELPAPRIVEGVFEDDELEGKTVRRVDVPSGTFHRHFAAEFMTGDFKPESFRTDPAQDAFYFDVWIDPQRAPSLLGVQIANGRYGRLGWLPANYATYYWGDDSTGTLAAAQPWSDPKRVKRIGPLPDESGWVRLKLPINELLPGAPGQAFESCGMGWLQVGGTVGWGDAGLELRSDKVTALQLAETAYRKWAEVPFNRQFFERRGQLVSGALTTDADQRTELQRELVLDAFCEDRSADQLERLRAIESELYRLRSAAMPVLVSRVTPQRKVTRLLSRGDYSDTSGPQLDPAFPQLFGNTPGLSADRPTRLDLAEWLFDDAGALTSRVFVNRLWHQFFGRGLCETLEDVGTQGDWPSHLELLDTLAVQFRDSGWDRDQMVRVLTSTRAYRLDSQPSADLYERDPGNRWHARQGRFRRTAESIRDSALAMAGVLQTTDRIPTDSFFPHQPAPYWERSSKIMWGSRHMPWDSSPDASQFQRSVYTFWKRQNIHPMMLAFDAPTRQECTAKRNITNTPGQALALLNDPIFVQAAFLAAKRTLATKTDSDRDRLEQLFQWSLQRAPSASEWDVLRDYIDSRRREYREQPDQAAALLASLESETNPETGDPETGDPETGDPQAAIELAVWTSTARTLLNLHEFVTRQ